MEKYSPVFTVINLTGDKAVSVAWERRLSKGGGQWDEEARDDTGSLRHAIHSSIVRMEGA